MRKCAIPADDLSVGSSRSSRTDRAGRRASDRYQRSSAPRLRTWLRDVRCPRVDAGDRLDVPIWEVREWTGPAFLLACAAPFAIVFGFSQA